MRRSLIFALVLYLAIVSAAIAGDADGNRDPSLTRRASVSFELDVMPILTARGCNQGACHGKSRGHLAIRSTDPFDTLGAPGSPPAACS